MRSSVEIRGLLSRMSEAQAPESDAVLDIAEQLLNVFTEWDWVLHDSRHARTREVVRDVTEWCLDENVSNDRVMRWLA